MVYEAPTLNVRLFSCKRWSCDICRPRRHAQLKAIARAGEPQTFITLTIDSKQYPNPDAAAQALVKAWRLTLQRARREKLIDQCEYLAVFESTRKGWPHLHILARTGFIPQQWLSDRLNQYAKSPVVDIRAVTDQQGAATYIAKYVSKNPQAFQGCKRYWKTRHWCRPRTIASREPAMPYVAAISTREIATWKHWLRRDGWLITAEVADKITALRTPRAILPLQLIQPKGEKQWARTIDQYQPDSKRRLLGRSME